MKAFLVGLLLMLVNLVGLTIPLRSELATEQRAGEPDLRLTHAAAMRRLDIGADDRRDYFRSLTETINRAVAHHWPTTSAGQHELRVPLHENFILYAIGYLKPARFGRYEYQDHERALERGIGLCSQQALIVSDILRERAIEHAVVDLDGHVVVAARVDPDADRDWILDPDYGVVVPHGLRELEIDPALIGPHYAARGYDPATISRLEDIYAAEGNRVYAGRSGDNPLFVRRLVETVAYWLKWLVPLLLMLPYLVLRYRTGGAPRR